MGVVVVRWTVQGLVCSDQGAVELCDLYRGSLRCTKQSAGYRQVYEDVKGKDGCDVAQHLGVWENIRGNLMGLEIWRLKIVALVASASSDKNRTVTCRARH